MRILRTKFKLLDVAIWFVYFCSASQFFAEPIHWMLPSLCGEEGKWMEGNQAKRHVFTASILFIQSIFIKSNRILIRLQCPSCASFSVSIASPKQIRHLYKCPHLDSILFDSAKSNKQQQQWDTQALSISPNNNLNGTYINFVSLVSNGITDGFW